HRSFVGHIVLFDVLMYVHGAAVGSGREVDRAKQETQNGTGVGRIQFRRLLPPTPTPGEYGPNVLHQIVKAGRFNAYGKPPNHHSRIDLVQTLERSVHGHSATHPRRDDPVFRWQLLLVTHQQRTRSYSYYVAI